MKTLERGFFYYVHLIKEHRLGLLEFQEFHCMKYRHSSVYIP